MERALPLTSRKRRRENACVRCHSYKIKCSGEHPCQNCQNSSKAVDCVYPIKDRKVPVSEQYLKKLEREVESLRSRQINVSTTQIGSSSKTDDTEKYISREPTDPLVANPLVIEHPHLISAEHHSRPVYLGDASGIAFGIKLRHLMNGNAESSSLRTKHRYYQDRILLRMSSSNFQLPERPYANILIRLVKRFLGNNHHLYLESTFTKRLDNFYLTQVEEPVWICRVFLIFALGELHSNRAINPGSESSIPGIGYFLTAVSLFQDLYEEAGVLYVETLFLASIYSDALNRTNSAYTYIGLALRISLTLGLHRNINSHTMPAAEREHRNRVWWTVHYLERLCSSKLGHPMMLRDEDISTALPSWHGLSELEKTEFSHPSLLIAQLNLAKIAGFVSRDMYTIIKKKEDQSFLQNAFNIFGHLKTWNESLPNNLKMDSTMTNSRSISLLHLLFNQCVILTTRPVIFIAVQEHVKNSHSDKSTPTLKSGMPQMAMILIDNCIHAARNINRMLVQLWVEGSIAMFSYTDVLILFTSTMILMISVVLKIDTAEEDRDDIETAWRLLRSMQDHGNPAAAEFDEQLRLLRQDLGLREFRSEHREEHGTTNGPDQVHSRLPLGIIQGTSECPSSLPAPPKSLSGINAGLQSHPIAITTLQQPSAQQEMWQNTNSEDLFSSFYLQGDSTNIFSGANLAQLCSSNFTIGDSTLSTPQYELRDSQRYNSGDFEEGMSPSNFEVRTGLAQPGIGGLDRTDISWSNPPFSIDLTEMNEAEIGSFPFIWD